MLAVFLVHGAASRNHLLRVVHPQWVLCSSRQSRSLNEEEAQVGHDRMNKLGTRTLLAIGDDPQSLALITDALAQEGLEILTASDPKAGFELFLQARPRTVVLDLAIPKTQGWICSNAWSAPIPEQM